ncbi:hypothetical protein NITHO_2610001 [Nitrolancea hollandica Lb]|uniref:Isoleucine--tRNA ligase n=1 Tax=Nitrolancea hollandica Lb TaxID=1129897 RepID=I4EG77_9BACT|nr:hypothetical protein NITHO_2610001 [Nitrolancea hollandica Lb]
MLVEIKSRPGYSVAEDRDFIVALDLTITPELHLEGLARDFVRGVQDARKNAGLKIEDTITTVYQVTGEAAEAIERFSEYIKAETLSVDLRPGTPGDGMHVEQVKVGKYPVAIGIQVTGKPKETD